MTRKYQISDWMLEKYLLDELDSGARQKILLAVETRQEAVVERLQKIQSSNREILTRFPIKAVSSQIQQKKGKTTHVTEPSSLFRYGIKLRNFLTTNGLNRLAYTAFALALCFPGYFAFNRYSEETRLKGVEPHLTIYRKAGSSFEKLENQTIVKANDLLQVSYFSIGHSYGVILSLDGRGSVTVHLPSASNSAALLISQKEVVLPTAFELDDAPQFDRFYFFTSNEPFLIAPIIEAIRAVKVNNLNEIFVKNISPKIQQYTITLKR